MNVPEINKTPRGLNGGFTLNVFFSPKGKEIQQASYKMP